jgi:hypothetical protein
VYADSQHAGKAVLPAESADDERRDGHGDDSTGFVFRLFASSSSGAAAATRVVIRSPSPGTAEGGFVTGPRPRSYYFADADAAQRARFRRVALSGDDVLSQRRMHWPGWALPWKVTTLQEAGAMAEREERSNSRGRDRGRGKGKGSLRIGKKRRIVLHKRAAALAAQRALRDTTQAERDAAEREKRTRRNREKKVKKKAREKAKKAPVETDAD